MGNWKLTKAQEPTALTKDVLREMRTGKPAGLSRRQLIRRSLGAGVGLWLLEVGGGGLLPPRDVVIDVLPTSILFALGLTLVVAPLTTALMASVPVRNAGVGSAINNAISRVGQPLILALLFIPITAVFWSSLSSSAPSLAEREPEVRARIQPLNPPPAELNLIDEFPIDAASTDAFHLAMLAAAGLLFAGAAVSAAGLKSGKVERADDEVAGEPELAAPALG